MTTRFSVHIAIPLLLLCSRVAAEDKVVRLYDGPAPGSESWKQEEKEQTVEALKTRFVTNVVNPTLSIVEPEGSKAASAAMVVCPGGGFHILSIDNEGYDVARWLASKGVVGIVLKYRLVETKSDNPFGEMMKNFQDFDKVVGPVVKLATADGLAAVGYVRRHATELGVKPERIGIMGFSAGGTVAGSVACSYTTETRPNFVAPIYPAWSDKSGQTPSDAPPIFIVAATDDQFGLAPNSIALYQQWVAAKKSAELHLFSTGGHGFGMRKQNVPCDKWIDQLTAWLDYQGMLKK
jgi:acetyl esterase/lipase